jgi:hypothetical protein
MCDNADSLYSESGATTTAQGGSAIGEYDGCEPRLLKESKTLGDSWAKALKV